ncbi:MAG TPA: protein-glutamate O-methyltransferase CheR [Clostridiaceae bacterium]|nr:protein-glutamate O-methyltransferase CheR [Clostridiaceae bacterium]
MDMADFEKWVFREFKIDLSAYKSKQLHRRIESLMKRSKADSIELYIDMLKKDPSQQQKFLDFITINVTEFFRNPSVFEDFRKNVEDYASKGNRQLKIWSAACSIGSEPYSIAMMLDEMLRGKDYFILATDIDSTILARAKIGEYSEHEVKNVSSDYRVKYFTRTGDMYTIKPELKKRITFKKHDLIRDEYEMNFDIIVCRNVVIYFKQETKDELYRKFSKSLKKGGLLFVGSTESMYNYREYGFEKASTFIYRKL